ncbi:MAG: S8/S53 family peptidase [Bacteroidota bacterium]
MLNFVFHGYLFQPSQFKKKELEDFFEKEGFKIEKISERTGIYNAIPSNSLSTAEIWDFIYSIPRDFYEFIEPDITNLNFLTKSSFINCDLPHKPGTEEPEWAKNKIKIKDTWTLNLPQQFSKHKGENIIIGHTDTGYTKHKEIFNNQLKVDRGWDYWEEDSDPFDDGDKSSNHGHGTSTGSLIISNKLIKGAAPLAQLIPIRVDKSVIVNSSKLVRGIEYAIDQGCHIISTSMGNVAVDGDAINRILIEAVNNGIISVSAAGQFAGAPVSIYPASSPYSIACTASNIIDTPWKKGFSSPFIKVAAPGESVWVADVDTGSINPYCGTSFSTALTAATAATWYSYWSAEYLWEKYGKNKIFTVFAFLLKKYGIKSWDFNGYGPGTLDAFNLLEMKKSDLPSLEEIEKFEIENSKRNLELDQVDKTCQLLGSISRQELISLYLNIFEKLTEPEVVLLFQNFGSELRAIIIVVDEARKIIISIMNNEPVQQSSYLKLQDLVLSNASKKLSDFLKTTKKDKAPVASFGIITNQTDSILHYYHIERKMYGSIPPKSVFHVVLPFPWVGNDHEFIERSFIIEVEGKTRFYIWDQDWYLRSVKSNEYLQGPFSTYMKIKMKGTEWLYGALIDGDNSKDFPTKEIVVRQKGSDYVLRVNNYG